MARARKKQGKRTGSTRRVIDEVERIQAKLQAEREAEELNSIDPLRLYAVYHNDQMFYVRGHFFASSSDELEVNEYYLDRGEKSSRCVACFRPTGFIREIESMPIHQSESQS